MNEEQYRKRIEEVSNRYFKEMQLIMQRYANDLAKLNGEYYKTNKTNKGGRNVKVSPSIRKNIMERGFCHRPLGKP